MPQRRPNRTQLHHRQGRRGLTCGTRLLAVVLIGAATLGGCSEGVLDPKGPIAAAERQILFNSLGIMLAIVIPTILATLGVACWFRSSNRRARYLPDFDYSGRLELLVWSIPAMTVLLVGGVAWIGAHDLDPRKPIASARQARQGSGRLARLEMAVHLPRPGHRERQSTDHPGRHAGQLRADLLGRDEQLLRAAARQPDLHHGRNGDAPSPAGRPSRNLPRAVGQVQRRRLCRHALHRRCGAGRERSRSGWTQRASAGPVLDAQAYADLAKPSEAVAPFTYRAVAPDLFNGILSSAMQPDDPSRLAHPASQRAEK